MWPGNVAAVQEQGLKIPRDLGNQAAKSLLDIIRHPNMQIQTYVTTSNLTERNST